MKQIFYTNEVRIDKKSQHLTDKHYVISHKEQHEE